MMKRLVEFLISILTFSCGQNKDHSDKSTVTSQDIYNTFDKSNHLQPAVDKAKFDTSHGWDLGWTLLEPINIAKGDEDEGKLSKRFSPGQKALYFIWHLDAEVTNGGFIQFYWNDYGKYVPPILDGLKLIGDSSMLKLVNEANKEYMFNKERFNAEKTKGDWTPLYDNLKQFERYDSIYYVTHDKTMELIEKYARQNPNDFVRFK